MTPDELREWAERHCTLFGINFPDDRATVAEWTVEFSDRNYTADELNDATSAMAKLTEPIQLRCQLAWINSHVWGLRERKNGTDRQRATRELIRDSNKDFEAKSKRRTWRQLLRTHGWNVPGERPLPKAPAPITDDHGEVLNPDTAEVPF